MGLDPPSVDLDAYIFESIRQLTIICPDSAPIRKSQERMLKQLLADETFSAILPHLSQWQFFDARHFVWIL